MNSIIKLATYLHASKPIVDKACKLTLKEFKQDKDAINALLGIYNDLLDYLKKLDNEILIVNDLNSLVKEIYIIDDIMLNNYGMVNVDLLYDFYKTGYKELVLLIDDLIK